MLRPSYLRTVEGCCLAKVALIASSTPEEIYSVVPPSLPARLFRGVCGFPEPGPGVLPRGDRFWEPEEILASCPFLENELRDKLGIRLALTSHPPTASEL